MKTNGTSSSSAPLAFDGQGNAILLPENAAGWRPRRHTGGRPRIILGPDKQAMRLRLDTSITDLDDMLGPGTYRLDLVDEAGNLLNVTVPVTVGQVEEAGDEDDAPDGGAPPSMGALPTTGSDLRVLLEANVRAMQLSFHHNQKTLETSLRVVDSLRDGVRVLAEAQSEWIKSLASNHTIRNTQYVPVPTPTPKKDDDDHEDDEEECEGCEECDPDGEEEYEPTFWQALGENLTPYAPILFETLKGKISNWVGPRNAAPEEDQAPPKKEAPPPPRNGAPKQPSRAQLKAMIAQKIDAAKKLLTEDEMKILGQLLAKMPDAERDRWIAELAPLPVEDAVVKIRIEIAKIGTKSHEAA